MENKNYEEYKSNISKLIESKKKKKKKKKKNRCIRRSSERVKKKSTDGITWRHKCLQSVSQCILIYCTIFYIKKSNKKILFLLCRMQLVNLFASFSIQYYIGLYVPVHYSFLKVKP